MSIPIGALTDLISHTETLLSYFGDVRTPEQMQETLLKLAEEESEEFHLIIAELHQATLLLREGQLALSFTPEHSTQAPGEAFIQGQEAASDVLRTLGHPDLAEEFAIAEPPDSFPFHPNPSAPDFGGTGLQTGKEEPLLLQFSDAFYFAASHVAGRTLEGSPGYEPDEAARNKLIDTKSKMLAIARHYETVQNKLIDTKSKMLDI